MISSKNFSSLNNTQNQAYNSQHFIYFITFVELLYIKVNMAHQFTIKKYFCMMESLVVLHIPLEIEMEPALVT